MPDSRYFHNERDQGREFRELIHELHLAASGSVDLNAGARVTLRYLIQIFTQFVKPSLILILLE